jgi:hypothetical protein
VATGAFPAPAAYVNRKEVSVEKKLVDFRLGDDRVRILSNRIRYIILRIATL